MATNPKSLTDYERLVLAYMSRQLSDEEWQICWSALEGETIFSKSKTPQSPKQTDSLPPDQVKFRDNWQGHYAVVETLEQAIQEITCSRNTGI